MAPRLIAAIVRIPSQVGCAGARKGIGDRPATWREHRELTRPSRTSCHSSRVKVQPPAIGQWPTASVATDPPAGV